MGLGEVVLDEEYDIYLLDQTPSTGVYAARTIALGSFPSCRSSSPTGNT